MVWYEFRIALSGSFEIPDVFEDVFIGQKKKKLLASENFHNIFLKGYVLNPNPWTGRPFAGSHDSVFISLCILLKQSNTQTTSPGGCTTSYISVTGPTLITKKCLLSVGTAQTSKCVIKSKGVRRCLLPRTHTSVNVQTVYGKFNAENIYRVQYPESLRGGVTCGRSFVFCQLQKASDQSCCRKPKPNGASWVSV